jgi:5-methylcytosine-specific restriction protein A
VTGSPAQSFGVLCYGSTSRAHITMKRLLSIPQLSTAIVSVTLIGNVRSPRMRTGLRRADGRCEVCGAVAPFVTQDGRPYLKPHHPRRLSGGGPDTPRHVVALGPTCHRRAHYAGDAETFNAHLIK